MSKILFIAEKKEVGIQIVSTLQNKDWEKELLKVKGGFYEDADFISSWAKGHLFTQMKPNEINENWGLFKPLASVEDYKIKDMCRYLDKLKISSSDPSKKGQIAILKKLLERNDVEKIIICTDADAEGEAIGRDIINLLIGRNKKVPIFRFWNTGSFKSKDAVFDAYKKILPLNDEKYERLYAQQRARSGADYLFGMKITKSLTDTQGVLVETGRLKSILISILIKRELDIKTFVPKQYWKLFALKDGLEFTHFYKNDDGEETALIYDKNEVENILDICENYNYFGKVLLNETKESVSQERPLPLSGTDFANEMMKNYKISLKTCTDILSFLREEGLTSYQGTNGRYFSENDKDEVIMCIDTAKKYFKNEPLVSDLKFNIKNSIFNNKKAEKQNHTPLTVREKIPNDRLFQELSEKSKLPYLKEAYELILKRVICNFAQEDLILRQKVVITIGDKKFALDGSKAIKQGWRSLMGMEVRDTTFDASSIQKGSEIEMDGIEFEDKLTTKPKPYTVRKFVAMMLNVSKEINAQILETDDKNIKKELEEIKKTLKNAEGIGTDRTRPELVSQLQKMNYIDIKGKEEEITCLKKAWDVYEVLPSESKTFRICAEWENSFEEIRNGDLTYDEFIKRVDESLFKMIEEIHSKTSVKKENFVKKDSSTSKVDELVETPKTYRFNENFIFKNFYGKDLTQKEALKLLKGEEIEISRINSKKEKYLLKIKMASSNDGKLEVIR